MNDEKKLITKKKIITEILIVLLITIITLIVIFNLNDFSETIETLKTVDLSYLGYATLCLIIYFLLWPLSLCLIVKSRKIKHHFVDSYLVGNTEHFFNGITPFSTGGQPIQVFLFTKSKLSAAESTGVILVAFVAYLIATNAYAVGALVYYSRFAANFEPSTIWMVGLGFAMNFFTLVFLILMATCKAIRDFFKKILLLLCKIKFIGKHLEKAIPAFDKYCENAQLASREIFKNIPAFIGAILLRGLALLFYYAIPFFILRSLSVDLTFSTMPFIILASAFAITTMVWVPTPGGTGGIEFAFTTIFTTFAGVTSAIGLTGMVIWRALTYYLLMIISFICFLILGIYNKKHNKYLEKLEQKEQDSNDTCLTNGQPENL